MFQLRSVQFKPSRDSKRDINGISMEFSTGKFKIGLFPSLSG